MLQRIRDRVSGWIAGVIIALVAGAFILFGVEYYFQQSTDNQNTVATVNGVAITKSQLSDTLSVLEKKMFGQAQSQPLTSELKQQLEQYALQSIITQTALSTTFKHDGFYVGLPQIKAMVVQAPQFQDQGKFSEQKFMQALYQADLTPSEFFQHVQSQWIIRQVTGGVAASLFVLPNEVEHWYGLQNQKRAFGYFIIPAQSFASKVKVTDDDIKNNYTQNQSIYETPAKVSVSYIVLSPADMAKNSAVTLDEAKAYYESHISNYQIPERWQVSQITIPVAENASTADVTKAEAQAHTVASAFQNNKNTGFTSSTVILSAPELDSTLKNTLSQLKVNKVSAPLRTQNGFTVLKLLKIIPAETHSFDSVKNNLMQLLQHQRVNEVLSKKSSELADLTYTNPDSLTAASKALNLPIQTSPVMTKAGEKIGIFSNPKILEAIFSDSVFKSDNNSLPIALPDGSQVVLRVAKKIPSQPIPLEKVSSQIRKALADKQASAQAGLLAYQLQKKILGGASAEAIAKQNGLQWRVVPLTSETEKSTVPQEILSAAFKADGTQAILINQHDYAVITVNQVKNADSKNATTATIQKNQLQLSGLWGQVMEHCLIDSAVQSSHVVMKHNA